MSKPSGTTDRDQTPTTHTASIADRPATNTPDLASGYATVELQTDAVDIGGGFGGATVPLGSPTAALQAMDASADHGASGSALLTGALPAISPEIEHLEQRVASDPHDVDGLFKLAIALHRAGRTVQARTALTSLARAYDERGQPAQATRILDMLATPGTGKLGTARLGTGSLAAPEESTAVLRQTTRLGAVQTVALRQTGLVGAAAFDPEPEVVEPPVPFPPAALTFTIPLPGQDGLPDEIREVVETSAGDLQAGRLAAAFDACLHGLRLDAGYVPLSVRIAEIYTAQRYARRARTHAETLLRLMAARDEAAHQWMVYRILLHTADKDLTSLRSLVELLIDAQQIDQASFYAAKLVRLLDGEGLADEALAYSIRLCDLIPGDTRAALENAVLRLKASDPGGAVDRWEAAVAAGADQTTARASLAAVMTSINEDDHWRMVAEVARALRERPDPAIVDAYARTAEVMTASPVLTAGRGLLLAAAGYRAAADVLAKAAGDRTAPPLARAASSVALADLLGTSGPADEQAAAIRTALSLLADTAVTDHPAWAGLVGSAPDFEDLSLRLAETLLVRQDPAGAVEVLAVAHRRSPQREDTCLRLADAYFRTGQLGAALTTLDELAAHYRTAGELDAMANVLRQMSQLAPNNIKVKSRLIDSYLQRGFVAEARTELVQRAELEERSGLINDAVASLQRSADLGWSLGLHAEAFALYRRIIALIPHAVDHRHALVTLHLQLGQVAEAAEHQRAIVDISQREGRKHEAVAALHQVIGLTPDDTSAYYQLGELLSSLGEYGQAERVFKRILSITPDDAIAQAKATAMNALRERKSA